MNKIEVGYFIRINGFISRIGNLHTSKKGVTYAQFKQPNGLLADIRIDTLKENMVKKDIIELIRVGDYVNGVKVDYINDSDYIDEMFVSSDWENPVTTMICYPKNIKTIVTKKMMESMQYKVGE